MSFRVAVVLLALGLSACAISDRRATPGDEKVNYAKVAAPGSFLRCAGPTGEFQLTSGTTREGVRSSIAFATEHILRGTGQGSTYARQGFRPSLRHDLCYQHGAGTSGWSRKDCDVAMIQDSVEACDMAYWSWFSNARCRARAMVMYSAIRGGGWYFHGDNPQSPCDYEGGPSTTRAAVVAGAFADVGGRPQRVAIIDVRGNDIVVSTAETLESPGPELIFDPATIAVADARLCGEAACTIASLGMNAADFQKYAPIIMDADGDGDKDIVLSAFNDSIPSRSDKALGMLFVPVLTSKSGLAKPTAAYMAAMTKVTTRSYRGWQVRRETSPRPHPGIDRKDIERERSVFRDVPLIGRYSSAPCVKGETCRDQAIFVSLNARDSNEKPRREPGDERGMEVRTLEYLGGAEALSGIERQRLAVGQEGWRYTAENKQDSEVKSDSETANPDESLPAYRAWVEKACFPPPGADRVVNLDQEMYKRLQYHPSLMRDENGVSHIVFSFRERFDRDIETMSVWCAGPGPGWPGASRKRMRSGRFVPTG